MINLQLNAGFHFKIIEREFFCGVFDTVDISDHIESNVIVIDAWLIGRYLESDMAYPGHCCRNYLWDWDMPRKILVWISGVPAKIRTQYLPDTSLQRHRFANPPSRPLLARWVNVRFTATEQMRISFAMEAEWNKLFNKQINVKSWTLI
jgi:hypothetical protein